MRIVFFSMSMEKGGAERVISEICNYGAQYNHEMYIFTCLKGKSQYPLDKHVIKSEGVISLEKYRAKGKKKTFVLFCKEYMKYVKRVKPDIVVSFLPEPCMIAELCKRRLGIPVIGSMRSNPYYQYRSLLRRIAAEFLYTLSDGFVFQTEGARAYFNKRLQKKSIVIGNPLREISPILYKAGHQKEKIVSVGRFTFEKNYPLLVRAFYEVQKQKPAYELYIYGTIDERLEIRELCEELHIAEKVHLCGQVDDVEDAIRDAAVFVLSSLSEGMPNALMEAMALGLPAVATDCPSGGPRQLIKNGENGILVENDNVQALAEGMLQILNNDRLAEELSANAKKIGEEYELDKICGQWFDYIEQILKENTQNGTSVSRIAGKE